MDDEKANQKIYKKEFQKLSEIVASKDQEVEKLKQDLQKMKSTYENQLKKLQKAPQGSGHLATQGSEDFSRTGLVNMYATQQRAVPPS